MGTQCCAQDSRSGTNDTVQADSILTTEQRRKFAEPDLLSENVAAQSVLSAAVSASVLDWSKPNMKKRTSEAIRLMDSPPVVVCAPRKIASCRSQVVRQAGDMAEGRDEEAKGGCLCASAMIGRISTVRLSMHTNSIRVDPSRFRLENKGAFDSKYAVQYPLGKGSFGEVRMIKDRVTGAPRAVKVVPKAKCKVTDNFMEEVEILKKLDHPNVLRFYEFHQDAEAYYLVTEYCEGSDLLTAISKVRHLAEADVLRIMKQILSALYYCHRQHIVHRDIKPENILFSDSSIRSTVKVIDFGRSKILRPHQKISELAGSLFYVAPEVLSGAEYDECCDMWSAGVLLYLLLSGKPPFYEKSKDATKNAIMMQAVEFKDEVWSGVSPLAKDLITKMLDRDQKTRINAETALKHPWINGTPAKDSPHGGERIVESLRNLRNFKAQNTFQKAVLSYIASQQMDMAMERKMRELFSSLDTDRNGQITEQELVNGYEKLHHSITLARRDALAVMRRADVNKNGVIDYNEFIMANLTSHKKLSENNLRQAFDFYDADKNGVIGLEELRKVFGAFCSEAELRTVMQEIDTNGDNQINFPEFKAMMDRYADTSQQLRLQWSLIS